MLLGTMALLPWTDSRLIVAETPEVETQQADRSWLTLVDVAKYRDSWETASNSFKAGVAEADWERQVRSARAQLGQVKSRKLEKATHATSLPGAPDGDYVVSVFDTSYEKKAEAQETVVSKRESDGRWRVAGYFIK